MRTQIDEIPSLWVAYQQRWVDRDDRMDTTARVVAGDWDVYDMATDEVENRSPNLIQVALEDTAESAALVPSIRIRSSKSDEEGKEMASAMERMAVSYMDASQVELLQIRDLMDLAAYGMCVSVSVMNKQSGTPYLQWRDPRTFYPEPGYSTMDSVRRAMFARELYATQLPLEWQEKVRARVPNLFDRSSAYVNDQKVTLIEYYTEEEVLICALYREGRGVPGGRLTYIPVELERYETIGGVCPVIMGQRVTLDSEPRGQFDQVVKVMQAHIRLMALTLDYADQAVYSDVYVTDLIGEMPWGGGSYIQLGPNGKIGRVPPAVSSFTVFEQMNQLVEYIHLGARWPKVRPGEVDQSIASAKFLEASAGMMNTVIRTYHLVMKRKWEQAMRVMFLQDKLAGKDRVVTGVLNNQQFMMDRDKDKIDLGAHISAEYGMGLGRDQAQSLVLAIQAHQSGFVSTEFVQENFEGITDVELERQRIDVQQLRDMAFARLMQGLEQGEVPETALIEIARARQNGEEIFELFDKFIAAPKKEQMDAMIPSGLGGAPGMPGPNPMAGMAPPVPPAPEELLGGGGPPETIGRLSVPLGDGSFMGSQS